MKTLRIEDVPITFYWTSWEFTSEPESDEIHRKTFAWIKKKPSRSASLWRLADSDRTRWFIVAVSEHRLVLQALEKRITKGSCRWYELPQADVLALVKRRTMDAVDALERGRTSSHAERHFRGRYKLNRDGSLEPLDRPQG